MTDLLLLGILIMMIVNFHYHASSSGRYMKVFDFCIHRPTKYTERKTVGLCYKGYQKVKGVKNATQDKNNENLSD